MTTANNTEHGMAGHLLVLVIFVFIAVTAFA